MSYPIILSFDVGVINLSYCLLTKKEFTKETGEKYIDFFIIDWGIIDLTNRSEQKCNCGLPAKMTNIVNDVTNYYCKKHSKEVNIEYDAFEKLFIINKENKCIHANKNGKVCDKKSNYNYNNNNYCSAHAKQYYNNNNKNIKLKSFKFKCSKLLNFDDVKYGLVMELEKRYNLLYCDHVVIENQPSFKNPRMKSIASTIYDYYLIRGIIDKKITNSLIKSVKFMSPSNKLKLATEGDIKLLIKVKNTDESKSYKLTKSLSIKYCNDMTKHLPNMNLLFNTMKKKDDMADSFLQGVYMYNNI
jgi:hypothetical protein